MLGIGLNVTTEEFPPELQRDVAAAGRERTSRPQPPLAALLAALDAPGCRGRAPSVLAAWRSRDALLGRTVRWSNGRNEGTAAGVDDSGALIVETA